MDQLNYTISCGCFYKDIPMDTESDGDRPWSLQFSLRPGHGALILAEDTHLLKSFNESMSSFGLMLHHSLADLGPLARMYQKVEGRRIRDTMQELYGLGNQPQGLKSAAYRLLGVRMKSWEDLVMPPRSEERRVGQ